MRHHLVHWYPALIVAAACYMLGASSGPPSIIEASEFRLVDEHGRTGAMLYFGDSGYPQLLLNDPNCEKDSVPRGALIGVNRTGGHMVLANAEGLPNLMAGDGRIFITKAIILAPELDRGKDLTPLAWLKIDPITRLPRLGLSGANGEARCAFMVYPDKSIMILRHPQGQYIGMISYDTKDAKIGIVDRQGDTIWEVP